MSSLTGLTTRGPAPPARSVQGTIRNGRIRTETGVRDSGQSTQIALHVKTMVMMLCVARENTTMSNLLRTGRNNPVPARSSLGYWELRN
jgi:hypothetical protein